MSSRPGTVRLDQFVSTLIGCLLSNSGGAIPPNAERRRRSLPEILRCSKYALASLRQAHQRSLLRGSTLHAGTMTAPRRKRALRSYEP